MKRFIRNAKHLYYTFRDEHGVRKTVPVKGLYLARRVDENGHVILTPYVPDSPDQDNEDDNR